MSTAGRKFGHEEALQKIRAYCAYQERPHRDVLTKLYSYGLPKDTVDEITAQLVTEGFLNEERFARTFSGGKFRMKKWGRIKIAHALEAKGLTPGCIRSGLSEIDPHDYRQTLLDLLNGKAAQLTEPDPWVRNNKLATFAIQKGYEADLVWDIIKERLD